MTANVFWISRLLKSARPQFMQPCHSNLGTQVEWPIRDAPTPVGGGQGTMPDRTSPEYADILLEAARQHGLNDEPDHEVGDLQVLFLACWQTMSPRQRESIFSDPDVENLFNLIEYK